VQSTGRGGEGFDSSLHGDINRRTVGVDSPRLSITPAVLVARRRSHDAAFIR
jgi:hypothetical protein